MTEQLVHDLMQWGAVVAIGWRMLSALAAMIESRARADERIKALAGRVKAMERKGKMNWDADTMYWFATATTATAGAAWLYAGFRMRQRDTDVRGDPTIAMYAKKANGRAFLWSAAAAAAWAMWATWTAVA